MTLMFHSHKTVKRDSSSDTKQEAGDHGKLPRKTANLSPDLSWPAVPAENEHRVPLRNKTLSVFKLKATE